PAERRPALRAPEAVVSLRVVVQNHQRADPLPRWGAGHSTHTRTPQTSPHSNMASGSGLSSGSFLLPCHEQKSSQQQQQQQQQLQGRASTANAANAGGGGGGGGGGGALGRPDGPGGSSGRDADPQQERSAIVERLREDPFAAMLAAREALHNNPRLVVSRRQQQREAGVFGGLTADNPNQQLLGEEPGMSGQGAGCVFKGMCPWGTGAG
ncbi:hypothetical protein Vretifemale_19800, partial [Volvox reticuliferus]